MTTNAHDPGRPDIAIVRLNEGFVMDYLGYTTAHTNADDLAERVRQVASKGEAGFQPGNDVAGSGLNGDAQVAGAAQLSEERRAVAQVVAPASAVAPATGQTLTQQWENVQKLIAFFAAGFDTNGKAFGRAEWDAALPMFAPHVDPKEAEAALGEFLAELHDDD